MEGTTKTGKSAYDKYIDYKRFSIAVAAFILVLVIPIPQSMRDVAVEYTVGKTYVLDFYTRELFDKSLDDAEQWQAVTARALEACMRQGALDKTTILKRNLKQLNSMGVECTKTLYDRYFGFVGNLDFS